MRASNASVEQLSDAKSISFAKKGIFLALLSGMIWPISTFSLEHGLKQGSVADPSMWILGPLLAAGLHDFFAAITCLCVNIRKGQGKEIWRTICSKPGRLCLLGALFGAPLGMGGYLMAVSLAGPAYILPITSLYPAIAAVLAVFFLKEMISIRAWCGLALCIVGGIVIGYTPPDGAVSQYFYLGLLFACIAALGWAAEGVAVTSGMDFVHPFVALNIYQLGSAFLYAVFIIPGILLYYAMAEPTAPMLNSVMTVITDFSVMPYIIFAGIMACATYLCWYEAMNKTGVARAMALNITYALWGIIYASIFTDINITTNLIIGAVVIFGGMFLVIGNPKEIVNLRNVC